MTILNTNTLESLDELFREAEIAKPEETRRRPYKFLDPYGMEDRDLFFGRDQDISELYFRLYRSRILLVYGESGSGKTSLLQCGLRSEIPAEDIHFLTVRSAVNPLESLRGEIRKIGGISEEAGRMSCTELLEIRTSSGCGGCPGNRPGRSSSSSAGNAGWAWSRPFPKNCSM